ncbi:hypothetical protein GCM10025873_15730 [Demequina sediminis]|nr:hypothetical protein GCM10025873_15730 [Demequina sediminis]
MTLTPNEILALPKVVLHDHLDGGLRPSTLIELAAEIGHELPSTDPDELARIFSDNADAGDLVRYLEAFAHTTAVMQSADNLRRIAREAVVDLAADGVIYAELRYAPEQHVAGGLTLQQVVEAVQDGIEDGVSEALEAGHAIRAAAILDAMRHLDRSLEIAQLALDNRGRCCVAFDIAGPELGFPRRTTARRSSCCARTTCPSPSTRARRTEPRPWARRLGSAPRDASATACGFTRTSTASGRTRSRME